MKMFPPVALTLFWLTTAAALADDPAAQFRLDPDHARKMAEGTKIFRSDVRRILVGRCLKCHGGESTEAEFDLSTRAGLLRGGAAGPAVLLGKSQDSRLVKLVSHDEEPKMPEDGARLAERQLVAIRKWIDLGAPYDKPLVEQSDDPLAWTRRKIDAADQDFWSFQPLRAVVPPPITDTFIRNEIDRFTLAKMQSEGVSPNATASKTVLIRRASFALLGLPPSAEEVAAFERDEDPQAYAKLVDRLLESPHYGERWGRHWLDVARFAESHGFEQDYDRPHAYHYRDFVIKALNRDMPFDEFVRWQLAGDEIAPNDPLAMMATGFMGAGVFPTQLTEKEFEPARYDALDDMTATMGTAMLAITIGCARCHDHKFDPIPQSDYYRIAAAFSRTIRSEIDVRMNTETLQAELAKWETEQTAFKNALAEFEKNVLPSRFDKWLSKQEVKDIDVPPWVILDLTTFQSQGGATLTKQADGSLLASDKNPDFDTYTFTAVTHLTDITAIRLEALAHQSLVRGGPGRASNGNMGLGNFTVTAEPLSGNGKATAVKLVNPLATFQQNTSNLSIAGSIDNNQKTGWAVDPQFGKDHAAIFHTEKPFGFSEGTKLTFVMEFQVNNQHNIGRPRLSISKQQQPIEFTADSAPQQVIEIGRLLRQARAEELSADVRGKLTEWYKHTDPQWQALHRPLAEHTAQKPQPQVLKVMVASEGFKPIPHHADGRGFKHFYPETYFLKRGDTNQKQGVAKPGFLQALSRAEHDTRWQHEPPPGARTSYRRTGLAEWITDADHGAGQLLARVIVNRLWHHHFGKGIVDTPNDFGFQGSRPSHPELLEWLAGQLIKNHWRLKPLHKLIMTSGTYQQNAQWHAAKADLDPDNTWLWRFQPRRLEAEIIRDAMLAVSGQLDRTMYGKGTLNEGMRRRSIYFFIKRSKLIPMMQVFDSPEPLVSVGGRPATTIAPQALIFMNNTQVRGYARSFAKELLEQQKPVAEAGWQPIVEAGYVTAVGRRPSASETQRGIAFLTKQAESYATDQGQPAHELATTDFCQVLMSLNEFVFVE